MPLSDLPPEFASGPFTVPAALSAGLSRKTLRGRRFITPYRGTRVLATRTLDYRAAVEAARLVLPRDVLATGVTGLRLLGVNVGSAYPLRLVTAHPHQVRRPGITVMRVSTLPERWDDLVAIPEHCWMAAALELNLLDRVTAGDWLLRLRVTHRQGLADYLSGRRDRGVVPAREAIALVQDRVDSPRETWLRLCLVLAGLPVPECNPTIRAGGQRGRVDLVYRDFRIMIEYEGDQHRIDRWQWNRDIERHEVFTADDWTVLRITADRAKRPRWIVLRVFELLRSAGYAGAPPDFGTQWRGLFE